MPTPPKADRRRSFLSDSSQLLRLFQEVMIALHGFEPFTVSLATTDASAELGIRHPSVSTSAPHEHVRFCIHMDLNEAGISAGEPPIHYQLEARLSVLTAGKVPMDKLSGLLCGDTSLCGTDKPGREELWRNGPGSYQPSDLEKDPLRVWTWEGDQHSLQAASKRIDGLLRPSAVQENEILL